MLGNNEYYSSASLYFFTAFLPRVPIQEGQVMVAELDVRVVSTLPGSLNFSFKAEPLQKVSNYN